MAVIGGGPAGLQASITGAKQGLNITLFEKHKIGENIKCAEGFFDSMKMFGEPKYGVKFKVNSLVIEAKEKYDLDCRNINLWMIDRSEWQVGLKNEAISKGVEVKEDFPVKSEDLNELSCAYDYVIDCSGIPSVTSIARGFSDEYRENWAHAYQVTLAGDFQNMIGQIRVGVDPNYFGYYWIFPKTKSIANVGLGVFPQNRKYYGNVQTNLKKELHKLLQCEELKNCKVIGSGGGVIPTKPVSNLIHDNIILAGDSGGFSSPLHGGGIDLAMLTAEQAVKAVTEENLQNYYLNIEQMVKQKLDIEYKITSLWAQLGYEHLDRLLKVILRKEAITELPKLFKFKDLLFSERDTISAFFDGFFYGQWYDKQKEFKTK